MTVTKEMVQAFLDFIKEDTWAYCGEEEKQYYHIDGLVNVEAALEAALAAMPGPAVKGAGNMPLTQALSRMAGNRQSDGTSSLVGREDRETIINWCHDMLIASRSALTPATDLAAENERLRKALEPFAACADEIDYGDKERDEPTSDDEWAKFRLLVGDYRRARAALEIEP